MRTMANGEAVNNSILIMGKKLGSLNFTFVFRADVFRWLA